MNLSDKLKHTNSLYQGELASILDFVKSTEKTLTRKQKLKPKGKPSKTEDVKALSEFSDYLNKSIAGQTNDGDSFNIENEFVQKLVLKFVIPMKHRNFLLEMTLSYLISYQEAMLKDYLHDILTSRKATLKSSSKISYDELLGFKSIKSLTEHLAQKEVDQLGYGSIDDVSKYYADKFNIEFSAFEKWDKIVESNFRRNLFIHNKGVSNETYCKRIGYKKRGKRLSVDIDYITSVADTLISFNMFCYETLKKKFLKNA
jgi:hypothetical protein